MRSQGVTAKIESQRILASGFMSLLLLIEKRRETY